MYENLEIRTYRNHELLKVIYSYEILLQNLQEQEVNLFENMMTVQA
jgi:hypothetical protein